MVTCQFQRSCVRKGSILPSQKQIPALDAISDLDICTLCFNSSIHSHWVGFARWTLYIEKSSIDALSHVIIMTVGCIRGGGSPLFCTKIWFQRSQFLVGYDFRVWLWNTKGNLFLHVIARDQFNIGVERFSDDEFIHNLLNVGLYPRYYGVQIIDLIKNAAFLRVDDFKEKIVIL